MKKLHKGFFGFGLLVVLLGMSMFFLQKINRYEHKDPKKNEAFNMIYTIEKFDSLREQINRADKETLLILDVDYTLTQPSNPAFQQANFYLNPQMVKDFVKSVPESIKSEFTSFIATSGEGQLLEEEAPSIIRTVKEKGVRILVISGILAGQWQDIPNIMDWRINNLRKLGIETSRFGFDQTYQFKDFPSYRGRYPEIKEGVILTNGEGIKKHQVLEAFFRKVEWRPKKIIFVDDSYPLIEQMADCMKQQDIYFIGYEYKRAKQAKARSISKEDFEREWINLKKKLNLD
ncbi:MAG TPA: DUF2608 domain-containing protein [Candidatus Rhabdochlamydia sp.]|jgi:hypothetical protein|nr:DUF2608 domain-containing protein [Candidatus Rhabdochlamydia sp.]